MQILLHWLKAASVSDHGTSQKMKQKLFHGILKINLLQIFLISALIIILSNYEFACSMFQISQKKKARKSSVHEGYKIIKNFHPGISDKLQLREKFLKPFVFISVDFLMCSFNENLLLSLVKLSLNIIKRFHGWHIVVWTYLSLSGVRAELGCEFHIKLSSSCPRHFNWLFLTRKLSLL